MRLEGWDFSRFGVKERNMPESTQNSDAGDNQSTNACLQGDRTFTEGRLWVSHQMNYTSVLH